jgi:hypothetical protein
VSGVIYLQYGVRMGGWWSDLFTLWGNFGLKTNGVGFFIGILLNIIRKESELIR